MTPLDYMQSQADATMAAARENYDLLRDRGFKLMVMLITGSGAVGSWAFARFDAHPRETITWLPLAVLALVWAGAATLLAWDMRTRKVRIGAHPARLINSYAEAGGRQDPAEASSIAAFVSMRRTNLLNQGQAIDDLADTTAASARLLNIAVVTAALAPIWMAAAAALTWYCLPAALCARP